MTMTDHPDDDTDAQPIGHLSTDLVTQVIAAAIRVQRAVEQVPGYTGQPTNTRTSRPTPGLACHRPRGSNRSDARQPLEDAVAADYAAAVNGLRRMIAELDGGEDPVKESGRLRRASARTMPIAS